MNRQNVFPRLLCLAGLVLLLQNIQAQKGHLFIIGGGSRPTSMLEELITLSGIDQPGSSAIVLPMSSGIPDTAAYYAIRQFTQLGIPDNRFTTLVFPNPNYGDEALNQLRQADLIYLTGGDQRRFMDAISGTSVKKAIHTAYQNGATIAGTSAGAALMSSQMITGDQEKHPEYTGYFRTIEADNMILQPGLGLLPEAAIDQHFIWRMRMNRLLTVILEHPHLTGIGIDESTAVIYRQGVLRVVGEGQALLLRHPYRDTIAKSGLLGGKGLRLDILLPGDELRLY